MKFSNFSRQISINFFNLYDKQIRKPMTIKKTETYNILRNRADYNQVLFLDNNDEERFSELKKQSFRYKTGMINTKRHPSSSLNSMNSEEL